MARLFIVFLLILSACITVNKSEQAPQSAGDNGYREWSGPGLYWGVYINNENDYWNHYHNHYGNGPHGGPHGGDGPHGHGPHGGGGGHR